MNAIDLVMERLIHEEGERLLPYDDKTGRQVKAPVGKISWGRGFNLEECGSPQLFTVMERYLVGEIDAKLIVYPWYKVGGEVRASVFLDMAYNAGVGGLLHFPHLLAAAQRGDWATAAVECKVADEKLDESRYAPLRKLLLAGDTE